VIFASTDAGSRQNVSSISAKTGFENHSHFIQIFKSYESITPLAYRKKWSDQHPSSDPLFDINGM